MIVSCVHNKSETKNKNQQMWRDGSLDNSDAHWSLFLCDASGGRNKTMKLMLQLKNPCFTY